MYRVAYVSSAVELFSDRQLTELLEQSRKKNRSLDITGMLLYKDGNFMQLLEGPRAAVESLVARIKLDPRHRGFIALLKEEETTREFSGWEMGFKKLEADTVVDIPGYSDFLELPLDSEEFLQAPSKALQLLLSFKKTMG